ncbi:MAG: TonB family protein [Gammaproteobacteria bacterium]
MSAARSDRWPGTGDRLAYALFLAAVAHAVVILGVAFDGPDPSAPEQVPTLEVTLLNQPSPDEVAPPDPDYLAQANQQGAGNTEEQVTPEFADRPPAPRPEEVLERGLELSFTAMALPRPQDSDRLLTPESSLAVSRRQPGEQSSRPARAPPEGGVLRVTGDGRREYFIAVNTLESRFAEYLAGWKARMERLGTVNFPNAARRAGLAGQPVLEVALAADGRLEEVRIVRSSGEPALDRAATELVRLGSPFDPFPPEVRASYDVLRFAYEWRFIDGRLSGSSVYAPDRP